MHTGSKEKTALREPSCLVLTFDVGTTGCKTCLYRIGETLDQVDACLEEYPLYMTPDGGVEQKVDEWWDAVCLRIESPAWPSAVRCRDRFWSIGKARPCTTR